MNRDRDCNDATHRAWENAKDAQDRIHILEKTALGYPEYIQPLSDMAVSYLEMDEIDNAIDVYQRIIDLQDKFKTIWENDLGKAYLFLNDYEKAIEHLKRFEVIGYDHSNGLFIAFTYLKKGEINRFKRVFDKWISKDLDKSNRQYYYKKYIKALFNEEEIKIIENEWNKYSEILSNMTPYQRYCKAYEQYCDKLSIDDDEADGGVYDESDEEPDDDDFEIPPGLKISQFEELVDEYLYLDFKTMFGEASQEDYHSRYCPDSGFRYGS